MPNWAESALASAGRGPENKVSFVAAVETTEEGRPLYVHLSHAFNFAKYAKRYFAE